MPERADARLLARHLRKLGFNAVRLQAVDMDGALLDGNDLSAQGLERLDYFSAQLREQGLYFTLPLHAARGFPALEGDALARFPHGKVLDRFEPAIIGSERDFARLLLTHVNPYTGHAYREEPALLYVERDDEDSLLPSRSGTPDDLNDRFRAELGRDYRAWLTDRTAEGLRAPGPADEEAKAELPTLAAASTGHLDYAQYLRLVERKNVEAESRFVQDELGLRSMLIDSQAEFGGLAGVLREAELSDFVDVHGAWEHPTEPLGTVGALARMASYRVFGKPFTLSEYGGAAPNDEAADLFPSLIGVAGLQDWDAVFAYAYAENERDYAPTQIRGPFDLAGHPAKLAFVTMAASAFRRGLVSPGHASVELEVPSQPSALPFDEHALPNLWLENDVALAAAVRRRMGIQVRADARNVSASMALPSVAVSGSDTGELLWDPGGAHPRFSIDAPALKAVCGKIANSSLPFSGVVLAVHEVGSEFVCVSLVSLDDAPISSSRRLLLTVGGRARNEHATAAAPFAGGPAVVEFVPLTLTLPRATWTVRALDRAGNPSRALPVVSARDSTISTTLEDAALSYAITR